MLAEVFELVKEVMRGVPDEDVPLIEAGLDSLGAVEFRNNLQGAVGEALKMPSTVIFDHPTVRQLATFTGASGGPPVVAAVAPAPVRGAGDMNAVTMPGLSPMLPGGANASTSAGAMLMCARDTAIAVPALRWDSDEDLDPAVKQRLRNGTFVTGAELFDHKSFGLSAAEAAIMNPLQRLLLEHSYIALHASGEERSTLMFSNTGIFVGVWTGDWGYVLTRQSQGRSIYALTGDPFTDAPMVGRVSFCLGLEGPNAAIDTACSSALLGAHSAMRAVQLGECSISVVGGVNMMFASSFGTIMAIAGMTAPSGRCRTWDKKADGYLRGEAVGAIALATTGLDAESSSKVGEQLGVAGSAVRQDGRSASLTAPNGQAQFRLLIGALRDASFTPDDLTAHEAHGTGTGLGDPIEARALALASLSTRETAWPPLVVGGVKANVGHAEPAAGLTGLMRLAVGLACGQAPANALLRVINPHVVSVFQELDIGENVGVVLPVQFALMSGDEAVQGRGGVSSFGYAGTLAHTMLVGSQGISELDATIGMSWTVASWSSPPFMLYRRMSFTWYTAAEAAASAAAAKDAPTLASSATPVSVAELSVIKSELPAPSVEAAILAMGANDRQRLQRYGTVGTLVQLSVDAETATLRLNDAEHFNTLSTGLGDDMARAVAFLRTMPGVTSVALHGDGAHFSAGGNPYAKQAVMTPAGLCRSLVELFDGFVGLRSLPYPVASGVHGTLVGGGIASCMNSDYIAAEYNATFEHGGVTPCAHFSYSAPLPS
jgi:3-oxoacyl-(acyl-carrier-protein) synthase